MRGLNPIVVAPKSRPRRFRCSPLSPTSAVLDKPLTSLTRARAGDGDVAFRVLSSSGWFMCSNGSRSGTLRRACSTVGHSKRISGYGLASRGSRQSRCHSTIDCASWWMTQSRIGIWH